MSKKSLTLLAFFLTFFVSLYAESYRIVPNYGHLDGVTSFDWDKESNVLLSWGLDSFCITIDLTSNRVLNRIALPGKPIISRLNPEFPEAAVVTEVNDSYNLTLFNWQTGEVLFQSQEREIPFFMEYSRSGEILLINDNPLQFLNHIDGSSIKGPEGISELLTFGYLGGSEKTFMGYSPSGVLIYYDRYSAQIKGRVETEEDLTDLSILSSDISLLAARKGNSIILVNRQNGTVLDSEDCGEIVSYYCQNDEGKITVLSLKNDEYTLTSYTIRRDRFSVETNKNVSHASELTFALYYNKSFLLGSKEGNILSTEKRGSQVLDLLPAKPLNIDHVSLINNRLLLASNDIMYMWESRFFEKEGLSTNHLLNLSREKLTLPLSNTNFLAFQNEPVVWEPNRTIKTPYYLLGEKGDLLPLYEPEIHESKKQGNYSFHKETDIGFKDLSFYDDLEVLISEDKSCRISRITEDKEGHFLREELYNYSHPSLETAAMVTSDLLALGTNTYFGGQNSINISNIYTGESFPISDKRSIVTAFLPDKEGKGFYSLGFTNEEEPQGIVKFHTIDNLFEEGKTILTFSEAPTNQCAMTQGKEGQIYVTTPDGHWYSSGEITPNVKAHSLDHIVSHNNYLYRIEQDHSLAICRENTLAPLVNVYFFDNGEWVAIREDSPIYFHSSEARELFTVYKIED
jgi:hypothetical protein